MSSRMSVFVLILTAVFWGNTHLGRTADIDKGPKDMVLQTTKDKASTPKPATFSAYL